MVLQLLLLLLLLQILSGKKKSGFGNAEVSSPPPRMQECFWLSPRNGKKLPELHFHTGKIEQGIVPVDCGGLGAA